MKIRSRVAIALVIPFIVIVAAALNYFGFCIRKVGFLSDEQALESALRHEAPRIEGLSLFPTSAELDQYRKSHPHCCSIIGEPGIAGDTFLDYITGFRKRWVRIIYKSNSIATPGYRKAIVAVVPCGQAVSDAARQFSEDQTSNDSNASKMESRTSRRSYRHGPSPPSFRGDA